MKKDFKRRAAYTTNPLLGILVSSDFIVIDIDNKRPAVNGKTGMYSEQTGVSDFDTLVAENEHLPMTLAVSTPSGEGYVMCPPSQKGMGVYSWMEQDTLGMRTPLAPLPKWILENILRTMDKNKPHFWLQKDLHTISPVDNEEIEGPHIALFKQSEWYQSSFQFSKPDHLNRINVTATAPYHCQICQRDHVKNSNLLFLVNWQGTLRFICRAGQDSSGHGFWRDIKANCHPDEGSRTLPHGGVAMGRKGMQLHPFSIWKQNINIRRYDCMVFDPSYDSGDKPDLKINMWHGFAMRPLDASVDVDMQKIQPILHHLKTVYANGRESSFEYIIGWHASLNQTPHKKLEVALVFTGDQGAGKNIFFDAFGKMIVGPYYLYCNDMAQLTKSFNAHTANKVLT
ncbi:hypothetical protein DFJ77DRAFT_441403, partial [Powellomyces hirtus]